MSSSKNDSNLVGNLQPTLKISFIGAGKMAQALAKGFMSSGMVKPENIMASSPNAEKHSKMQEMGITMTTNNLEVIQEDSLIILAVKPHLLRGVLVEIRDKVNDTLKTLLVSIAAGIPTQFIEQICGDVVRVVRVMPNTAALVQHSASAICGGSRATEEDLTLVQTLFSSIGICQEVPQRLLDAATGVSGSGIAYGYMMIEAMSDGGVKMGLPRDVSTRFAAQALLGAAEMVLTPPTSHPALMREDVCSPGGCTIHALHDLERNGFRAAVTSAVEVAAKRCQEMAAQQNKLQ